MTPPVVIAVVNQSTAAPELDGQLPAIVSALGRQLAEHLQPFWGRVLPSLALTKTPPTGASQLVMLDDADQADALGYHDETPDGVPYGRVFVRPILGSGGTVATGANSISATLSHELLEMVGDPSANLWADGPGGFDYAVELCDAVEGDAYEIDGIAVSNFVLPAFFDPQAAADARFDYVAKLGKPFTMTPGGYQIRRTETGAVSNVFGEAFPAWKLAAKAHRGSRTSRRARRSAPSA